MIEFIMFFIFKNKMCCTRLLLAVNVFFLPFFKNILLDSVPF
jgi:hypothetical protein